MFKQVVKYSLMALIWKRYRRPLVATLILIAYFWLVSYLHQDVIAYLEMAELKHHLGWSFAVKWLLYLVGVVSYGLYLSFSKAPAAPKPTKTTSKQSSKKAHQNQADPFDNLRTKSTLRSKSDLVIEKYPKKSKQP